MTRATIGIFLYSLICINSYGADVVDVDKEQKQVIIENDPIGTWKKEDQVCVVRGAEKLGCGLIKGFSDRGAHLVIMGEAKPIQRGDSTYLLKGPHRNLASVESGVIGIAYEQEVPVKRFNLQAGVHLSLDTEFPLVEFDYAVTNHVVLGISPTYITHTPANNVGKLTAYGASLTTSYYLHGAYQGPWAQAGVGYFSYTATDSTGSDSSTSPALTALIGWRERWAAKSNIGLGLGARYMPHLTGRVTSVKFQEIYPIAVLTVGYEW